MHQPLHTASLYSSTYTDGDSGGNERWVIDPATNETVTLHWFWDDAVHQDSEPSGVVARAREIEGRFARASLQELRRRNARAFARWSFEESFPFSREAFPMAFTGGASRESAVTLPAGYAELARQISERRIAVAGYRLADLLCLISEEREGR